MGHKHCCEDSLLPLIARRAMPTHCSLCALRSWFTTPIAFFTQIPLCSTEACQRSLADLATQSYAALLAPSLSGGRPAAVRRSCMHTLQLPLLLPHPTCP